LTASYAAATIVRNDNIRANQDMAKRIIAVVFDGFLLLDMAGPLGFLRLPTRTLKTDMRLNW
jgi:hypothetical protein